MNKIQLLCIDLQKDFSAEGGKNYRPHANVEFIKNTIVPFFVDNNLKIAEIVSDYRQPRPGDRGDSCDPGTDGYTSELDDNVKKMPVWKKCMNSPIWVRDNIGDASLAPGFPYEDTKELGLWLDSVIGDPKETDVALIGLTLDCCVLCCAQELSMRGYKVYIIEEGVDVYTGLENEKRQAIDGPIIRNWASVVKWDELKNRF